ncbi:DUF2164 domain-containing protein [Undibacterium arcticum]|uniref:DUF2164 domain-containing protein n=1 Tax=Undibacterium arcticum TaxID=1762892 RepID=A0ABV7F7A2_9BURK
MEIKLKKEVEQQLIGSIQRYFARNMDGDIGELQASMLLHYVVEEIGPSIYNQAIADAQAYMLEKVQDLEISCHAPEFDYWHKSARNTAQRGKK